MQTLIIGLDAFDPNLFEKLYEQGKLPNLGNFLDRGGYSHFQVSNPPQSEVSWTSIATGLNPGSHGMFDFVHRDPKTYNLQVSLLPIGKGLGGLQFVRPYNAKTIFDAAAEAGFPSTSLWWPATFPARPESPIRTLPGLGTPDIQGRLGVGAFYSNNIDLPDRRGKTPVFQLKSIGNSTLSAEMEGPQLKTQSGLTNAVIPIELQVIDEERAQIRIDKQITELHLNEWSAILQFRFKTSWLATVHAITRIVLTSLHPYIEFYVLPLQIHPLHSIWRYGTPASFVKDAWQTSGPFLTLGWPQDTTGLEDGCISDELFLNLCSSIFKARVNLLFHHISKFNDGLLASVFDSLDRIQHMFWSRRPDVIEAWYIRFDQLIGSVISQLEQRQDHRTRLLIMSDHGFNRLDYKVHLNSWLIEKGYLTTLDGAQSQDLKSVDWNATKAYAIGLNSLYLNIAGRERDGRVQNSEKTILTENIRSELKNWIGPQGHQVVSQTYANEEIFNGPASSLGPDILVGYNPGFRASAETGLGGWKGTSIENNHDHWEADHCFDAADVPGVLFSSIGLNSFSHPSYHDIPALSIDSTLDSSGTAPPPVILPEDQEKVEERLRSLGYL
jgi:predicted AlkP superfamily phosphohydrolase/phosphomutase